MDTLTSLRVFCAVAELKSFSAAADRLGLSPAMVSKHVIHLEQRLAARLQAAFRGEQLNANTVPRLRDRFWSI